MSDPVNTPEHYRKGNIECIEAMEEMASDTEMKPFYAYLWINTFKYLWRWPYKNGLEDLKKARWYLDKLISKIEEDLPKPGEAVKVTDKETIAGALRRIGEMDGRNPYVG